MNDVSRPRIAILGATGYSGREAVRLLARHPRVSIALATSESEAGASLSERVRGAPPLPLVRLAEADLARCDLALCCLPHGESVRWAERALGSGARVVDLSADLRVAGPQTPKWAADAVYGLTELHRERIRSARVVANPGCYPTAAILALAPLLRRGLVSGPVVIHAASGVTGAGRTPRRELLFGEVAEDFRAYAAGNVHRHLAEMREQAAALTGGRAPDLVFAPHLLPVRRGILATIHVPLRSALTDPLAPWREDYAGEAFVQVLEAGLPSLGDVVHTNRVAIGVAPVQDVGSAMLQVVAAIDNLVKGAAGQAVQNLNLMLGFPEAEGLT